MGGDFYPNSDAACTEPADASVTANDNDEVVSRIRELTYRLGYNRAKTKMLLGQWAKALLGLERSLLNEVEDSAEESPDSLVAASGGEAASSKSFNLLEDTHVRRYEWSRSASGCAAVAGGPPV